MKFFLTIFSLGLLIVTVSSFTVFELINEDELDPKTQIITFDGFEGDTYFFSNKENKAFLVVEEVQPYFNQFDLKSNKHIGTSYRITTKRSSRKKTPHFRKKDFLKFEKISE